MGKTLEKVIGINPILGKDEIFGNPGFNDTSQELLEKIGLQFNEFCELVVGYVDLEKYLTLFLSQSGAQSGITTPNNSMITVEPPLTASSLQQPLFVVPANGPNIHPYLTSLQQPPVHNGNLSASQLPK